MSPDSEREDRSFFQKCQTVAQLAFLGYGAICISEELLDGFKDQAANPFQGVDFHEVENLAAKKKPIQKSKVDCHLMNSQDFKNTTWEAYRNVNKKNYRNALTQRTEYWTDAIFDAFISLGIPPTEENVSLGLILMHRESRMDTNPKMNVTGAFARKKKDILEKIDEKIPVESLRDAIKAQVEAEFARYQPEIEAADTEIEVNNVLIKIGNRASYFLGLAKELAPYDPLDEKIADFEDSLRINTIGVLQVNPRMMIQYWATKGLQYNRDGAKHELWSLTQNLRIGFAIFFTALEEYLSLGFEKKDAIKYAFADYNAGIYSSRNAALQKMIADLSGVSLKTDGDMLIYEHDGVSDRRSSTERAVKDLFPNLDVRASLLTEKSKDFDTSDVYQAVKKAYRGKHERIDQSELAIVPDAMDPDAMEKYGTGFNAKEYTAESIKQYQDFYWKGCK